MDILVLVLLFTFLRTFMTKQFEAQNRMIILQKDVIKRIKLKVSNTVGTAYFATGKGHYNSKRLQYQLAWYPILVKTIQYLMT